MCYIQDCGGKSEAQNNMVSRLKNAAENRSEIDISYCLLAE